MNISLSQADLLVLALNRSHLKLGLKSKKVAKDIQKVKVSHFQFIVENTAVHLVRLDKYFSIFDFAIVKKNLLH